MNLSLSCEKYQIPLHPLDTTNYDTFILLGTQFSRDNKKLDNTLLQKDVITFSPIEDDISKQSSFYCKYEAGTEEGVLALLLFYLAKEQDDNLINFLNDLDIGYLSAESNIGEEEAKTISLHVKDKKTALILGADLKLHPKSQNIAKLLSMLIYYCTIDTILLEENNSFKKIHKPIIPTNIEELESFDGVVTYKCPSLSKNEEKLLIGSKQFAISAKLNDTCEVLIQRTNDQYQRKFIINDEFKGTIALLPSNKKDTSYRYEISKITRVETK